MKVLGIESSSLVASVALVTDDILTAEYTVNFKKTHSQTLLPMLDEIVKMLGLDLETIDAIATAGGPGSFTGLRIGAATAKGLGLALKKPLIHVPTVDAIAYNMWGASGLICPIMDAKRCQVYTGLYHMENGIETVMEQCPMDMGELISWARIACETGYIDEKTAWEYIKYAGEQCRQTFRNWNEIGKSYLIGQAMITDKKEEADRAIRYFLLATQDENSPWRKNHFSLSTT